MSETFFYIDRSKLVFQNDVFKLKDHMGLSEIRRVLSYMAEPFRADIDRFNRTEARKTAWHCYL